MTIHIGFTGPRKGMVEAQQQALFELVRYRDHYFHHGDCIGADAQADAVVRRAPNLRGVIMHPSNLGTRAHCRPNYPHDIVREPFDPLVRDKHIVDEVSFLIAAPREQTPVLRSGTWTTVRYAQAAKKDVCFLFTNGAVVWDYAQGGKNA